jgi:PTS system fructose-specific IIC component
MALADLMTKEVIRVPLESKGKIDIITELVNIIDEAGYLQDKQSALEAVISRENQGSTGLAEGIAVPHAKTDAVSSS